MARTLKIAKKNVQPFSVVNKIDFKNLMRYSESAGRNLLKKLWKEKLWRIFWKRGYLTGRGARVARDELSFYLVIPHKAEWTDAVRLRVVRRGHWACSGAIGSLSANQVPRSKPERKGARTFFAPCIVVRSNKFWSGLKISTRSHCHLSNSLWSTNNSKPYLSPSPRILARIFFRFLLSMGRPFENESYPLSCRSFLM